MIISISGTHCTGKSTLVELLKKQPELKDAVFYKSSGRALAEKNPKIRVNEDGDFFTQMYQMSRDAYNILEESSRGGLLICDRSYIDTYVYSLYLYETGKLSTVELEVIQEMKQAMDYLVKFDKVFLLKPSFELQNEKNRSMNEGFQEEVAKMFEDQRAFNWEYLPDGDEPRVRRFLEFVRTGR